MFDTLVASLPHVRSGTIRTLAVCTNSRLDILPDIPRVADTLPGFEVSGWSGIAVRKGVPTEIIERLNTVITAGLGNPTVRERIAQAVAVPMPFSSAHFGTHMAAEARRWGEVVKLSGVKPE